VARVVLCNGVLVENGRIELDADDEGFLLGRAIFETLRTYDGRLFELDHHLERLASSALAMGIKEPDEDRIAAELTEAADAIQGEAVVRVTVTAGGARIVRAGDLPKIPRPFRCVTRTFVPPHWLDGTVKHTSRAWSRAAVLDAGVEEVLWTDPDGFVLEGTRSNVFAVVDGALVTPPVDGRCLAGVTRTALIEAAIDCGTELQIRPLHFKEEFAEFYVSSTLKELTGVDQLNGAPGAGAGPVGSQVLAAFRANI
jgi:branched-chain amino acid aminotransferase